MKKTYKKPTAIVHNICLSIRYLDGAVSTGTGTESFDAKSRNDNNFEEPAWEEY